MKVFIKNRGSGKTMRMLYASELTDSVIVCSTEQSKKYILSLAKQFDINILPPMTVKELLQDNKMKSPVNKKILIDNMEDVMSELMKNMGYDVVASTISK